MALQSNSFHSDTGDDEAATRNFLSRKKPKRPSMASSSSNFNSHHSTTAAAAVVCNLSPSQTARITQQFDHSLIAWIVGKDIRPWHLAARLHRHLRLTEELKVFDLGYGYFVLKFSEIDYLALDHFLPWSIPNLCIYSFPWTPDFKPSEAINSSVDVWIRLHELSIEYYDDEIFQRIAEAIGGDLVMNDPVTKDRKKCKFARICVRVNLCNPLPSTIMLGKIPQEIEYEGFDLLCLKCRFIGDLKHNCSSLNNPSGSSGSDPSHHHSTRPCKEIGLSSSSSSSSKPPLIPSEPSPASGWGSRFHVLESNPMLDLELKKDPSLLIGVCEKADSSRRINSPSVIDKDKVIAKQKGKFGTSVSVQAFPTLPTESTTITTIKAPELKLVAPSVVENQFKAAKPTNPTMIADRNSQPQPQPQPSSTTPGIPLLPPCPASEASLKFHSDAIQCSTRMKEITNAPSKEFNVDSCPTVYTIDSKKISSLKVALSEVRTRTTTVSNQNQYAIDIFPTLRVGDEGRIGSEVVSGSESCSKKMLCWKFHGTDNAKLMRALKDLIQLHEPSIVLIFGTKISSADADQVVRQLAYSGSYHRKPDGYNGGVWLLLSKQAVQIEVDSYSPQQVSASVHFHPETNVPELSPLDHVDTETSSGPWGSTFFYTSTNWMSSVAY